jgi:protein-S-isoprenylcysteine O-methyltransferase Ste14
MRSPKRKKFKQKKESCNMKKSFILLYGVFAYIIALIGQVWFILYLGEWEFMAERISDTQNSSLLLAFFINILLVMIFGLQHTVMARDFFKNWLTKFIPEAAERSTYVLLSGLALMLVAYFWEPIDGHLWQVENETVAMLLTIASLLGWTFSVVATFIINHFELFGLQQVYLNFLEKETPQIDFQERLFYTFVRHPIQLGVLLGIWFTPNMTFGHLLFSTLFTMYILLGLHYEEKDLLAELGETYALYMQRVSKLIPFGKRS